MFYEESYQKQTGKAFADLKNLAFNLRSSWNHSTDILWRELDPELWELTNNPWAVLQTASSEKIKKLLDDKTFSQIIASLTKKHLDHLNCDAWFQTTYPKSALRHIAYFSMEYMLSEALPIYSGGLGNVAGDQLKAASDLGVPVIAIGLLYSQGYFRQFIDKNGMQQELYPYNDPGQLPITPLRKDNGEWLRVKIELPGWPLWLRVWQAQVGRNKLYLLDSNDIANFPAHRGITCELYGGDCELRLKQELILGIGGWRLLQALNIDPEVCHMNEGHAAFVVLERALSFMKKTNHSFSVSLAATRAGNVFTTHTAVTAGFDRFPPDLVTKYLGPYAQNKLGLSIEQFLSLGQLNKGEDFNMAYLAIRGSNLVNGVSRLHATVSQNLFEELFPRWPREEIPVGCVTNGVHVPSWDSPFFDNLWTEGCGNERWLGQTEQLESKMDDITDEKLWQSRQQARAALIDYTRHRLKRQLMARGVADEQISNVSQYLDPNVLTFGFARRFAPYKRPDLLLVDQERLLRILTNSEYPVQLIIAGKAHPADMEGHLLIQKWMRFINLPQARSRVVFLSDDDMILTQQLVQGVDVWINTPRRPWEACGTSGMKILVNGGLNLSTLDGWWAQAYTPEVGWAFGDSSEHDDPHWDAYEANNLYDLLEQEVIPLFYKRNTKNIPKAWTAKVRASMASLTPYYSSNRAVREYTTKYYIPAAQAYVQRAENNGALAQQIVNWENTLKESWGKLKFGLYQINSENTDNLFELQVYLADLDRQSFKVELYSQDFTQTMSYFESVATTPGWHIYRAKISATVPVGNLTARIIPYFDGVNIPIESAQILWQR